MLFKRLLLTLFPEPEGDLQFNPATFFINFVSSKQFFTVILRKIVENYKLYFYDINFDPFEVKIGIGNSPTIRLSEIEKYFSYISVAEMNGYRFFSPVVVSTVLGFVAAYKTSDIFKNYRNFRLYVNFVLSVVLLYYVFLVRIKRISYLKKQNAFSHFLDIFFNFYRFINEYNNLKIDDNFYKEIRNKLLKEKIDLFFSIFYVYIRVERVFLLHNVGLKDKDFFEWLFYDESKMGKYKSLIRDYIDNYGIYQKKVTFSTTEKMILNLIFPSDILIMFFLDGPECYEIVENVLGEVFGDGQLDKFLRKFLDVKEGENNVHSFLRYLTNYRIYKERYFKGVKKFIFKSLNIKSRSISDEYVEDLLSSFSPDMKLPSEIKKEGMLAEKLVNFYLSFIGSFWVGRGDTGYFKLYKRDILENLVSSLETNFSPDTFYFIGGLLYLYGKNVFYYQYAFESIKSGKGTFRLPTRPLYKEIYSSPALIHFLNESAFSNLLEDVNYKDIKLYIRHTKVIERFKTMFGGSISTILQTKDKDIVDFFYKSIFEMLDLKDRYESFKESITNEEIKFLRSNLYSLNFWIFKEIVDRMLSNKRLIKSELSNIILLHIFAILRQTFFGLIVLYTYLSQAKGSKDMRLDDLFKIYYSEILLLNFNEKLYKFFKLMFDELLQKYSYFLKMFIKLDDNRDFLKIVFENWKEFVNTLKENEEIQGFLKGEDIVWLRGVLKNITFYNRRYFIPEL